VVSIVPLARTLSGGLVGLGEIGGRPRAEDKTNCVRARGHGVLIRVV
jgi:hypothetical protein